MNNAPLVPAAVEDRPTTAQGGTQNPPSAPLISHFAIKLPPFIRSRPDLWFSQAESQFALGRVTTSTTKFHHVMSVLPEDVLVDVADVLTSPSVEDPYSALKSAVIARSSPSDRQRLHEVMSTEPLGDRKPTHLLSQLRHILRGTQPTPLLDDRMLGEIFMSKLPPSVQMALSASDHATLDSLAQRADRLMELHRDSDAIPCISAAQASTQNSDPGSMLHASITDQAELASLRQQIRRLADTMENFRFGDSPPRGSSSRPSGRRERLSNRRRFEAHHTPGSPSPTRSDLCWYHTRFGRRARRCESPCVWSGNSSGNH